MDKFELELRHRPKLNQSIENKHKEFLDAIQGISAPWGLTNADDCHLPPQKDNLTTTVQLDRHLGKGVRGYVTYQLRSEKYLEDRAQYDDVFFVEFNSKKVDYGVLVFDAIPSLIKAFGAYRAAIRHMDIALEDWQIVAEIINTTGKDIDGRDGVYRINAVNYWDEILCKRAFNKEPIEIVQRLSALVPRAEMLNGGAYVVCVNEFPSVDTLQELNTRLKQGIKGSDPKSR